MVFGPRPSWAFPIILPDPTSLASLPHEPATLSLLALVGLAVVRGRRTWSQIGEADGLWLRRGNPHHASEDRGSGGQAS